jgi:hypothetical protein
MGKYKYTLIEDKVYYNALNKSIVFNGYSDKGVLLISIFNGDVTICKGYSWDGCSPKLFKIFGIWVGTPDGKNDETKDASGIHDPLYQFHKDINYCNGNILKRITVDLLFLKYMLKHKWSKAKLYYKAVRLFGGFYWKGDL